MAIGDVTTEWDDSVALTATALQGLATGGTDFRTGWASGVINLSTLKRLDMEIKARLRVASASVVAGEARMYFVRPLSVISGTVVWPDLALSSGSFGTEGAVTWLDNEQFAALAVLGPQSLIDTGVSEYVWLFCDSLRQHLGTYPSHLIVYITQTSGVPLETSGSPNLAFYRQTYEKVQQA